MRSANSKNLAKLPPESLLNQLFEKNYTYEKIKNANEIIFLDWENFIDVEGAKIAVRCDGIDNKYIYFQPCYVNYSGYIDYFNTCDRISVREYEDRLRLYKSKL